MIQYQILQTNITRTIWQTVRRITNKILGVIRLKLHLWQVLYLELISEDQTTETFGLSKTVWMLSHWASQNLIFSVAIFLGPIWHSSSCPKPSLIFHSSENIAPLTIKLRLLTERENFKGVVVVGSLVDQGKVLICLLFLIAVYF